MIFFIIQWRVYPNNCVSLCLSARWSRWWPLEFCGAPALHSRKTRAMERTHWRRSMVCMLWENLIKLELLKHWFTWFLSCGIMNHLHDFNPLFPLQEAVSRFTPFEKGKDDHEVEWLHQMELASAYQDMHDYHVNKINEFTFCICSSAD